LLSGLAFQMQRLAEVARAAIVVEGDYPDLFRTQPGRSDRLQVAPGRIQRSTRLGGLLSDYRQMPMAA